MLSKEKETKLSKMMTKLLRHAPGAFGLTLDPQDGSVPVERLLQAIRGKDGWRELTLEQIETVVQRSDKQRFELADGRIRARYGHSYERVAYEEGIPPAVLYHGTSSGAVPCILQEGIVRMGRQYVHLSEGLHFASLAGSRKGTLSIVTVDTEKAREEGVRFYFAGNVVWLADFVPPSCCGVNSV